MADINSSSGGIQPSTVLEISRRFDELSAGLKALAQKAERIDANLVSARELVRHLRTLRRLRSKHLPGGLFSDPAWDMLIELKYVEITGEKISVSSLGSTTEITPTTCLRHIERLISLGLISRSPDPRDGRRFFVQLTSEGSASLDRYLLDGLSVLR